jgi:hypothetical protein
VIAGSVPEGDGPRDPKAGRFDGTVTALRLTTGLVAGAAIVALLLGSGPGDLVARVAITLLVAAPLVRVGWLAVRWFRRGDRRFGLAACGVLAIVAAGVVLA